MNKKLNIYECGPRDGWQNIQDYIPVEEKQKIIDGLGSQDKLEAHHLQVPKQSPR